MITRWKCDLWDIIWFLVLFLFGWVQLIIIIIIYSNVFKWIFVWNGFGSRWNSSFEPNAPMQAVKCVPVMLNNEPPKIEFNRLFWYQQKQCTTRITHTQTERERERDRQRDTMGHERSIRTNCLNMGEGMYSKSILYSK